MKAVFLIGNGFDINLGLKTKYTDFYEYYLELNSIEDSPSITKLKNHLREDRNNPNGSKYQFWSDMEEAMGTFTMNFEDVKEMKEAYYDLNDKLKDYISHIEKEGVKDNINRGKLISDLAHPERYLREVFKREFTTFCKKWERNAYETFIISFNYTNVIEKTLAFKEKSNAIGRTLFNTSNTLYPIIHIHGTTKAPLIGVNDVSQIKNSSLRENEEVQECLIKPKLNEMLGHLEDVSALKHIQEAILIYIFGVSLGDTDKIWWLSVGERLKQDCRVIYFVYNPNEDSRPSELNNIRRKYKNILLSKTNLNEKEKEEAFSKIFIVLNSDMFNLR